MTILWPNGGTTPPVDYRKVSSGFRWTSPFGMRTHPVTHQPLTFHYGIDLIGWAAIKSAVNGVVSFAGYNGGAGNEVRVKEDGTGDVFRDLHNSKLLVRTGQRVRQGQDIAIMGTTGSSTGIHCHHEVRPGGGAAVEPLAYYQRRNGAAPAGGITTNEEDDVFPAILEIKNDSQARKSLYDLRTGRAIRLISKDENTSFRAAQAAGACIYISVSKAEYQQRGGK